MADSKEDRVELMSRYDLTHKTIGKFIIINNDTFVETNPVWPARPGSDLDALKLKETFEKFGFDPVIKRNLTKKQMIEAIENVANEDHSEYDCLAIAILTHGDQEGDGRDLLIGADGKCISLQELMKPLKNAKLAEEKKLAGKPKLIFIQACRGTKFEDGVSVSMLIEIEKPLVSDSVEGDTMGTKSKPIPKVIKHLKLKVPAEADFLYHYSTASGFFAWRSSKTGAVFIQKLCDILGKYVDGNTDLLTLLTYVNRIVAEKYESKCANISMTGKKQMPVIQSQLRMSVFLSKIDDK